MYDPLTHRYRLTCPTTGASVNAPLTRFRELARLPGPEHPPVYRVTWACTACRELHAALVREPELDIDAVVPPPEITFLNLMTGRHEPVADELVDRAERELRRGNWPWSFACAHERRVRPAVPSQLRLIDPTEDGGFGVAVRCTSCGHVTANLVSGPHIDRPFYHDRVVRYAERTIDGAESAPELFREGLRRSRIAEEPNAFAA